MGWEGIFAKGFRAALRLNRDGLTFEAISHRPEYDGQAYGRGMYAAVEAFSGWLDLAEREARSWGFTRETARQLIAEAVGQRAARRVRD